MDNHIPRRLSDQEQNDRLDRIEKSIARMEGIMTPISETYSTVTRLGKWGMALLVFISVLIGIVLGVVKLFDK